MLLVFTGYFKKLADGAIIVRFTAGIPVPPHMCLINIKKKKTTLTS